MIKTFLSIEAELKRLWPNITVMGSDRNYWCPKQEEVKSLLWDTYIERYKYTVEIFDCDDFALLIHAFVAQERYRKMQDEKFSKEEWLPWAFGEAWGNKFDGQAYNHAVNICLTRDKGVIFVDPQNDQIWNGDPDSNSVYFIRM